MESNELKNKTSYDSDVKSAYDKIANRESFKYSPSADPAYRAYRDQYQREGKLAMRNTLAETSDLTGGYASSYAQNAGQQQYGAYLEKLNNVMPELYSDAWQRYQSEGEALNNRLRAASELSDMEYGRNKDAQDRADKQAQFAYTQQQDAFKSLAEVISSTGYVPSEEELARSGMSRELAYALGYEFMRKNRLVSPDSNKNKNVYSNSPYSIEALKLSKNGAI